MATTVTPTPPRAGAPSEPGAVAETRRLMEDLHQPQTLLAVDPTTGITAPVLIIPRGMEIKGIAELIKPYRTEPERRTGRATLTDLPSLIAHVNRFKDEDSAMFADRDPAKPSITAVLDYHRQTALGRPRFGTHRAHYAFPLSEPWKAWAAIDGKVQAHTDFAVYIEDRIADVIMAPESANQEDDARLHELLRLLGGTIAGPTRLLELSRGLKVNEAAKVASATNLSTGEVQIQWETEHRNDDGQPIRVPNLFLIAIPVFEGGPAYRLPVRLRYRLSQGKISWIVQRYRTELTFDHAFNEACDQIRKDTGLPLFMGTPEVSGTGA